MKNVNEKYNGLLQDFTQSLKDLRDEEGMVDGGAIFLVATVPLENEKVGQHVVLLGEDAAIGSSLTISMVEKPHIESILVRTMKLLPMAKMLHGIGEECPNVLSGLLDELTKND